MRDTRIVKLFKNGASQAVRLPADFRFEGDEVYVTRDADTGDVILSANPGNSWRKLLELIHRDPAPESFLSGRPLNAVPQAGGVFDERISPRKGRR